MDSGDFFTGQSLPPATPPGQPPRKSTAGVLFICPHCGELGEPRTLTPGSFGLELGLWLLCLLPGLVYSIWRLAGRRKDACPRCSTGRMVPYNSPAGQQIFRQFHPRLPDAHHWDE
jgi:hypothetical protein